MNAQQQAVVAAFAASASSGVNSASGRCGNFLDRRQQPHAVAASTPPAITAVPSPAPASGTDSAIRDPVSDSSTPSAVDVFNNLGVECLLRRKDGGQGLVDAAGECFRNAMHVASTWSRDATAEEYEYEYERASTSASASTWTSAGGSEGDGGGGMVVDFPTDSRSATTSPDDTAIPMSVSINFDDSSVSKSSGLVSSSSIASLTSKSTSTPTSCISVSSILSPPFPVSATGHSDDDATVDATDESGNDRDDRRHRSTTDSERDGDYDEGMNTYDRPLRIDTSSIDKAGDCYLGAAPVILFNLGRLHVSEGNDVAAAEYFHIALDVIRRRRAMSVQKGRGGDGEENNARRKKRTLPQETTQTSVMQRPPMTQRSSKRRIMSPDDNQEEPCLTEENDGIEKSAVKVDIVTDLSSGECSQNDAVLPPKRSQDAAIRDHFQPERVHQVPKDEEEENVTEAVTVSSAAVDAIPVLHNLGHVHYRARRYGDALSSYARALKIAVEADDSPSGNDNAGASSSSRGRNLAAANSWNCMGVMWLHLSGNATTQRETSSDTSADDEIKSEDKGCDATSRNYASRALSAFRRALSVRCELLGRCHVDVASIINNIGRVHYMLGDHEEARDAYIAALDLRRKLLPPRNLDLAVTAYNLGQTHHRLGDLDAAMDLYADFHRIASARLGPHHRDVAASLRCMAEVHHEWNEPRRAVDMYRRSLRALSQPSSEVANRDDNDNDDARRRHPEVASVWNKIGNLLYESSDFDAAIDAYEEGLRVERASLNPHHPDVVVTLSNIARTHERRGDWARALERYAEACASPPRVRGPDDARVASALRHMAAQACCRLGRYERALDFYQDALRIRRDALGDDHLDVASSLNSIGLVLFKRGLHGWAFDSFAESLRIRVAAHGPDHRDVAVVLYNIAMTKLEQGDCTAAMAYFRETVRVERAALGRDHKDAAVTMQVLGQVHHRRGELDEALGYYGEVLRIERKALVKEADAAGESSEMEVRVGSGSASPLAVARLLNRMGDIYLQQADVPNMMKCFSEAMRLFEGAAAEREIANNANALPFPNRSPPSSTGSGANGSTSSSTSPSSPSPAPRGVPSTSDNVDGDDTAGQAGGEQRKLEITGYIFYAFSVLHPECAAAA